MTQEDTATSSRQEQPELLPRANADFIEETQGYFSDKTCETSNMAPFFPVTREVTFKPAEIGGMEGTTKVAPDRGTWHVPPAMARIVSLVSLSAMVLWPLSGCGDSGSANLPCPVPTPQSTQGTQTPKCTTSGGTHYLWMPIRGGWVASDDGVHPNRNAHGIGEDNGHGSSGGDNGDGGGHGGFGGGGHGDGGDGG